MNALWLPTPIPSGQEVRIRTSQVSSTRTLQPLSLYSLPFCAPHEMRGEPLNIGEVLQGSVVVDAPFSLKFGVAQFTALCMLRLDHQQLRNWDRRIREDYRVHLTLDELPLATRVHAPGKSGGSRLELGYRLGHLAPAKA